MSALKHTALASTWARAALAGTLLVSLAVACLMPGARDHALAQQPQLEVGARMRGPESVAPLAERLIDAVVNISTTQNVKGPSGAPLPNVPKGSPFEELFDDFFNPKGGKSRPDSKQSSLGSGFVIDGVQGLIVTNKHVIDNSDEIIINFNDGSKLKVDRILGQDAKTDLALLKVTPKRKLAAVAFGDSTRVRVGDWVLAIGNPFGLGGSVSIGIISAKQRDISSGPYDDYLQTDAAINKGNSGGPLFNMDGDVIGVNTAIISPSGGSIGIGFAVPSDSAKFVVEQLFKHGKMRRGWLGVRIQNVGEDGAQDASLPPSAGAMVASVTEGSPAAQAGIRVRDVITKFDGRDIRTVRGLPRVVAQTEIGRRVPVELLRDGKALSLTVTVGHLAEEQPERGEGALSTPKSQGGTLPDGPLPGVKLAPLSDELRQKWGYEKRANGVLMTEVEAKSVAAQRGLKAGEIIVEVASEAVTSIEDIRKGLERVRTAQRRNVLLKIETPKGEIRSVAYPLE